MFWLYRQICHIIGNFLRTKNIRVGSIAEREWRETLQNSRAQETDWIHKTELGKEKEGGHRGAKGKFQRLKREI